MRLALQGLLAIVVALLIAGCGGGEGDDDSEPTTTDDSGETQQPVSQKPLGPSKAKESFDEARESVVKTLESEDCEGLDELIPVNRTEVDGDALCKTLRAQLEGAKPGDAESYEGGAVIDYQRDDQTIPLVLFVDEDGRYHLSHADPYVERPSVGTDAGNATDQAADRAVAAFASRQCDRVGDVLHPRIGVGSTSEKRICRAAKDSPIARIRDVNPDAEAVPLGGNATYAFYGLATSGVHYTMIIGRLPEAGIMPPLPITRSSTPSGRTCATRRNNDWSGGDVNAAMTQASMSGTPLDFAAARIESGNRWTRLQPEGLILHPNPRGQEPVNVTVPAPGPGSNGFSARLVTRSARCRPLVIRVEAVEPGAERPTPIGGVALEGTEDRQWELRFEPLVAGAELRLACELAPGARDHRFSAVLVSDAYIDQTPPRPRPRSVGLLFDGRLSEYFDRRPDEQSSLVLHHIPKTAGSSLFTELGQVLRPRLGVTKGPNSQFETMKEALAHHLPAIASGKYKFITGHFDRPDIGLILAQTPAEVVTILRDPVGRVVSDYRYTLTPKHPGYEKVRVRYPTLESYLDDPRRANLMFRRLRRSEDDTVADVIDDVESNYAFVGLTEEYPLSRRTIFSLVGAQPPGAPLQANRTVDTPENQTDWRDLVERIREVNEVDVALYEHFRGRFAAIRGALAEQLDVVDTDLGTPRNRTRAGDEHGSETGPKSKRRRTAGR